MKSEEHNIGVGLFEPLTYIELGIANYNSVFLILENVFYVLIGCYDV